MFYVLIHIEFCCSKNNNHDEIIINCTKHDHEYCCTPFAYV